MVEVSLDIDAPAEDVYKLVSDLPRMGEWSPQTTRVVWRGGATGPVLGAKFRGDNKHGMLRWSTFGTITAAEPGREFSFEVGFGPLPVARWSYRFESLPGGGCRVTESTEDRRGRALKVGSKAIGMGDREAMNRETMQVTLERLKTAAEASTATRG
ncbi:MAG: hypothetical protein QOK42_1685 [Frankiaceae bacterium]|jgi:uncharacterized protein YndB with AHSA1/START domain|nr:hypothetical protein [Frankiaceae bacterium]MDX6224398.1 hypothetical protein [Frankiales bacterium]